VGRPRYLWETGYPNQLSIYQSDNRRERDSSMVEYWTRNCKSLGSNTGCDELPL